MMYMNKKGSAEVVVTYLLLLLSASTFGTVGSIANIGDAIGDTTYGENIQENLAPLLGVQLQTQNADGRNVAVTTHSVHIQQVQNESAWGVETLYDINNNAGHSLLIVQWDEVRNAIDGKNLHSIENDTITERGFAITTTGGQSFGVDPLNSSYCEHSFDSNTYICAFPLNVTAELSANQLWYSVDAIGSGTNHDRFIEFVNLDATGTFIPTTSQSVTSYYFTQSQKVIAMIVSVLEFFYYFIVIGMSVAGLLLLAWVLRMVYDGIANRGVD